MSQQAIGEVENTEHISDRDGENINAKRTGLYGYDYDNSQWRRVSVDSNGSILGGILQFITIGTLGITNIRWETAGGLVYDMTIDETGHVVTTLVGGGGVTMVGPWLSLGLTNIEHS
jgi:hypothetical protein